MTLKHTAVVFPGQGTQHHGMGQDFYNQFAEARHAFEEASDALGWDVAGLCFGEDPRLHLTEFAQPCILATEIAMFRSLENHYDLAPGFFGGHSLGEYTALTAVGSLPLFDAVKIVHARGKFMQKACPPGSGGMAAVIAEALSPSDLEPSIKGLDVDIANINAKNQIVLSGDRADLATVEQRLASHPLPGFRFVPLQVSAAFHSRMMSPMVEAFEEVLHFFSSSLMVSHADRVTSNVTGGFHSTWQKTVLDRLTAQITAPVKWRSNMDALASRATTIMEIGPARPLSSFFRTQGIDCVALTSVKQIERRLAA